MTNAKTILVAASLVGGAFLCGCTTASPHLTRDFGVAERQDMAAQIADPDAHYLGKPAPGSNGQRAALAQTRYVRDRVIQPVISPSTSVITAGAGGGQGSGGGGGDTGASSGPQ